MSDPNFPPPPPIGGSPPPPPPGGGKVSENRGVMIALSYLGLLALIPLLVEKEDQEVQWHAKHGIVLLVAEIVLFTVVGIMMMIIGQIPVLGCVTLLAYPILVLAVFIFHIMAIVKGINGQRLLVPGVSQYADRF